MSPYAKFAAAAVLAVASMALPSPSATAAPAPGANPHYTPAGCNAPTQKQALARCFATVYTAAPGEIVPNASAPPPTALGPAQIQNAYDLPSAGRGQGQTVAIVDAFGDSHAEADLAEFRAQYGLPPCTTANGCFSKVDQRGGTSFPIDDSGWALETALDLDAVSAVCPNCHILLVEGDDNNIANLGAGVDTAVALGAKFVSNSYGISGEDSQEAQFDQFYTHPGVAVTASTGDAGGVTSWPATNPDVAAIGGTTLTEDTSARGWHESAWVGGGAGCSPFEPQPSYQVGVTTGCANRAIADISADADPQTGLAVFDTLGAGGWLQVGGTSLSSPLVAGMYALAGTPVAGTFPVSYPYGAVPAHLFDVTDGGDGPCGTLLCNAGPGWDGPTGLGTPDGVQALTIGAQADIVGAVTDSATGAPIAGATVSTPQGYSSRTDTTGHYDLALPVGTYDVTAQMFAYQSSTRTGVVAVAGTVTTADFALDALPRHTLSGTVTDGSGHGWPLYAKIVVSGYPGGAVYTDPFTGHYSVALPQGFTGSVHVTPVATGYVASDATVSVEAGDVVQNFTPAVDATACDAPGYAVKFVGAGATFTGWTDNTPQDGWSNVDDAGTGDVWRFDNPGDRILQPGFDSDFAIVDSDVYGPDGTQDTSLVSPTADLSTLANPTVQFDVGYKSFFDSTADVDLSLDNGATWTTIWERTTASAGGHVTIPVPQAAGVSDARLRFHYTGADAWWWMIDNVVLGASSCAPVHGGLVAGLVSDGNTGQPVDDATITDDANGELGVSAATPDDPGLPDGFYELFSSLTGAEQFTAAEGKYTSVHAGVTVAADEVTRQDFGLRAGHLVITPGKVAVTETLGTSATRPVTFTNDGTQPVQVNLAERGEAFTPTVAGATGAPLALVPGRYTADAATAPGVSGTGVAPAGRTSTPFDPPWMDITDYPNPVVDNAVASNAGKVYSVGGANGATVFGTGYVYDPTTELWSPIAPLPQPLEAPGAAFVDGTMYVVGGWAASGVPQQTTYAYDPDTNHWTRLADMPVPASAASVVALDGQVYVVGGCTSVFCSPSTQVVQRYDVLGNTWTQVADYPNAVSFLACAAIVGEVVCAGGLNAFTLDTFSSTFIYTPASNSWTRGADLPVDAWAATANGANGRLQVAGGVIQNSTELTNQVFEYDPADDTWASLPNSNNSVYRGGGGCGFYQVGGSPTPVLSATASAQVLPGFDQCGQDVDVPWLRESTTALTVPAGQSVTVTLTVDSSGAAQPGGYTAQLAISTDSPYKYAPVNLALTVNPPKKWGKITGTVTDAATGVPLAGATVQINAAKGKDPVSVTLKTDAAGHYQLWLDATFSPLQLIVANDHYQPQALSVKISQGKTTIANVALNRP